MIPRGRSLSLVHSLRCCSTPSYSHSSNSQITQPQKPFNFPLTSLSSLPCSQSIRWNHGDAASTRFITSTKYMSRKDGEFHPTFTSFVEFNQQITEVARDVRTPKGVLGVYRERLLAFQEKGKQEGKDEKEVMEIPFNDVNYMTIMNLLREKILTPQDLFQVNSSPDFKLLMNEMINVIPNYGPSFLSSIALSLSRIAPDSPLFKALSAAALKNINEFVAHDLANFAWALARGKQKNVELMDAIAARSLKLSHTFLSSDLSTLLWSASKLEYHNKELFQKFAQHFLSMKNFSLGVLGKTAWAYTAAGIHEPKLIEMIQKESVIQISENPFFSTMKYPLVSLVWASSVFTPENQSYLQLLCQVITKSSASFSLEYLTSILNSLGAIQFSYPPLFKAALLQAIKNFDTNTLSIHCEFYASLISTNFSDPQLSTYMTTLTSKCLEEMGSLSSNAVASLIYGLTKSGVMNLSLLFEIEKKISSDSTSLTPLNLSRLAWALVELDKHPPSLFPYLEDQALTTTFQPNDLVLFTWSLALYPSANPKLLSNLVKNINEVNPFFLTHDSKVRLYQIHLLTTSEIISPPKLSKKLQMVSQQAYLENGNSTIKPRNSTPVAQDLFSNLNKLKIGKVELNHVTEQGLCCQIAIPEKKFCLELLTRNHVIESMETRQKWQTGSTKVTSQILKKLGWSYVPIHEQTWKKLSKESKQELSTKLMNALN